MDQLITAERALTPAGWRERVAITVQEGVIAAVDELGDDRAADHHLIAPGFVDLQVNGVDDVDVGSADGDDWARLASLVAAQGTTTWCPTLITGPLDAYAGAFDRIGRAMQSNEARPVIAGVHMEGPFLGHAHGAHPSQYVIPVDLDVIASWPLFVRVVTLGAETDGAVAATQRLVEREVVVSIGHSEPSTEQIESIVAAGATLVTHMFNAMSGVHHRRDGLALTALTDDRLAVSLIADGVHVSPRAMSLIWRARPDGVVLVTDAVAWRRPDHPIAVVDGAPRRADGTIAGSCLTMDAAVRNSVAAGATLADALVAASRRPAHLLGLHDRGDITVGARADLVALDEDLSVRCTWVGGIPVHTAPAAHGDR